MTAALILAAGYVSEPEKLKPTEEIGGASAIKRLIMIFRQAGIKKTVVVTGYAADALEKHCAHMGAIFLRNNDFETADMLGSVKIGLSYLKDKCLKTFITPADVPLFSTETLTKLAMASEPAVIPVYKNKTGHPLLLSNALFERVIAYEGVGGLESALSGDSIQRCFCEVPDEGILMETAHKAEIDSTIIENHCLRRIRPEVRIKLLGEKAFFGPGTLQLLSLTNESGSLKQAAQQMGLSYSKAWKMITEAEEQLGHPVIESRQGGRQGGGSEITAKGLELMKRYEAFEAECGRLIAATFEKHFENYNY